MTDSPNISAVVFDLDDTLYAERDYVRSGYLAVAAHLQARLNRDGPWADWLWQRFLAGKVQRAFNDLSDAFGLSLQEADIAELINVYRTHRPRLRAFADIPPLLSLLRADYKLGLLSDGYLPTQALKLEAVGLERFFDAVLFTESLGRQAWKPATEGFEWIARRLETPHAQCCYVADNVAKDFIPPNRLGWRTIQYVRPGQLYSSHRATGDALPQTLVRSPEELRDAVRAVRRNPG